MLTNPISAADLQSLLMTHDFTCMPPITHNSALHFLSKCSSHHQIVIIGIVVDSTEIIHTESWVNQAEQQRLLSRWRGQEVNYHSHVEARALSGPPPFPTYNCLISPVYAALSHHCSFFQHCPVASILPTTGFNIANHWL